MKTLNTFIIISLLALVPGCKDNSGEPAGSLKGTFVSRTDCKGIIATVVGIDSSEECIQYSYTGNTLAIKHINAGFNCCPVDFNVKITVENNVILIDETAATGECFCLCLYDVNYKIENLPASFYEIQVKGNVDIGSSNMIKSNINLSEEKSGTICEKRSVYPWVI